MKSILSTIGYLPVTFEAFIDQPKTVTEFSEFNLDSRKSIQVPNERQPQILETSDQSKGTILTIKKHFYDVGINGEARFSESKINLTIFKGNLNRITKILSEYGGLEIDFSYEKDEVIAILKRPDFLVPVTYSFKLTKHIYERINEHRLKTVGTFSQIKPGTEVLEKVQVAGTRPMVQVLKLDEEGHIVFWANAFSKDSIDLVAYGGGIAPDTFGTILSFGY
jgi:hypothetical protein